MVPRHADGRDLTPSNSMTMSWCGDALIACVSMPTRAYAPAPALKV
jgi:hypothetical protein